MEGDDILILLSHHHLLSAIHLAQRSGELEQTPWDTLMERFRQQHPCPRDAVEAYARSHPSGPANMSLSYTIGAVVLSCSAVEARINELFFEAKDDVPRSEHGVFSGLARAGFALQYGVLERYQVALLSACSDPLDTGAQPYQDVHLLFRLRNCLVHFEPRWGEEQKEGSAYKALTEGLRSRRLHENPLVDTDYPFFPMRCLSYDCARWAVRASHAFVHEFLRRMGLKDEAKVWATLGERVEELGDLPGWSD
ncbi:hypothetical protein KAX17_10925 [Candidatus Bipolaricaulota bacterium]|nr:hypothetical protein [Candidatus Bipolaricaulota bacterium]